MTRSDAILATLTREVDRRRRTMDSDPTLNQVVFCLKLNKRGKIRAVQVNLSSEEELEEKAA